MDAASLGSASLTLEADLSQLRADLDDAKARVAAAALEMQKMLDRHVQVTGQHFGILGGMVGTRLEAPMERSQTSLGLWAAAQEAALAKVRGSMEETTAAYAAMADTSEASADLQVASSGRVVEAFAAQAEAARIAADAEEEAAARSAAARAAMGRVGYDVVGRGAVAAAAEAVAARSVGREGLQTDTFTSHAGIWGVRGPVTPGSMANPVVVVLEAASRTPLGTLAAAIGQDSSGGGAEGAAVTKEQGGTTTIVSATPEGQKSAAPRPVAAVGLEAQRQQAMQDALSDAQAKLASAERPTAQAASEPVPVAVKQDETSKETGDAVADAILADLTAKNLAPGQKASTTPGYERAYEALGYTVASRVPGGPGRLYAPGGQPGSSNYGLSEEAALLAAQKTASGGRGGGGGGIPTWLTAMLWGHAGGGGGGGGYSGAGTGMLGHLFFAGAGGMAGMGSLGSFAGFGPEHLAMTVGGIAGSGVAALGGGALLGAGALGKLGVGMGSDLAVSSSAIADTTTLYTSYEKLREAVAQYGKASTQAKEAQAELNATMKYTLSGTKGVAAELGLAEKVSALNVQWDKQTSGARVAFVHLAEPLVEIASHWIPAVNKAAEQNFTSMAQSLKPFFSYLKGPEAMGLFEQLEDEFHEQIPTAMKALDEGFQFFAKTIGAVAPLTGGLMKDLDNFFTKMDEPQHFAKWEEMMSHMIKDFHVWGAFIKELGGALVDLFDKDAHTGEGIIETLTKMLHGVREWEKSVTGSSQLRTIFTVHKEEVIALLEALSDLVAPFEEIYMTLSPPLVRAVTAITEAVAKMLVAFEGLGPGAVWIVGLGLVLAKLKLLVPLLKQVGLATGLLSSEVSGSTKMRVIPTGGTAAAGDAAEGASVGEETVTGALLTDAAASIKTSVAGMIPDLLKGALAGLVTSMGASALGVHGTTNTALSAGVGAGVVTMGLGPEVAIPAALATAGMVEAIHALNQKAPLYGEEFAKAYYAPFAVILPKTVTLPLEEKLAKLRDEREKAEHPHEALSGLTHLEEKIPGYGSLFTAGPSAETAKVQAKERAEGVNAAEAFKQGFRDSTQKSAFGFSLAGFQALFDMTPTARKAAAQAMLAYAAELVKNKKLPANALGEIIHQLERYFPELTASFQRAGSTTSKALTAALNLREAEANTEAALQRIDDAFGTSKLTVEEALKSTEYAIAHSTGAQKHYWEEKLSALQHATHEEVKAAKASAAAQLESLHDLDLGLKSGVTSWETYANGVTAWREKLSERVGMGIESLSSGINTINKMLEGELKGLGAPAEVVGALVTGKKGVSLKANPVNPSPSAGEGGPLLAAHAVGGLVQIGRPGEAGRDTVGLNVGGLPIAVAPGEQVAVFNRHQLPIVNAALAPMGGLPGLFSQVSTPNYMASGGIVAPHVSGSGAIPGVVRAGLAEVAKAANSKVGKVSAASTAGGGGSIGHYSGSWVQVMRQIAKAKGWSLTDWEKVIAHESGGQVSVLSGGIGPAFGLGQLEPENYHRYGGGPGSSGVEQIEAMARYIAATYGNPTKAWASEVSTGIYAHGGLLGFAVGGIVPGFAAGGAPKVASSHPQKTTRGFGANARKNPKGAKGKQKKLSGTVPGLAWPPMVGELEALINTTIPIAQESYTNLTNAFSLHEYGSGELGFIITEGSLGEQVTPYENLANVEGRLQQLRELVASESGYKQLLEGAQSQLGGLNTWVAAMVKAREKSIAELKAKIKELQKKIDDARHTIEMNLQQMQTVNHSISNVEHHISALGDHPKKNAAAIKTAQQELSGLRSKRHGLEAQNKELGGSDTAIGEGGKLHGWEKTREAYKAKREGWEGQVTGLKEHHGAWGEDLKSIQGAGGGGGTLAEAGLTLATLGKQMEELSPGSMSKALAKAKAQASPSAASTELTSLLKQQNEQLSAQFEVSQAQYKVLANLPPFGGSFATGGVVPGPVGSAKLVVAHGGEGIGAGGAQVHLHFANGMEWLKNYVRAEIRQETRDMTRGPSRPIPSRGGGQLV